MHVGNSAHVHRIVEDAIRSQLEPVKDTIRGQLEPVKYTIKEGQLEPMIRPTHRQPNQRHDQRVASGI